MKKILFIIISISFILCFTACNKNKDIDLKKAISSVELSGNLVTLQSYYHNVAEVIKPAGTGITHLFEKDRKMWIEYTGTVKLGINLNDVEIKVKNDEINVYVPKAKIIGNPDILEKEFTEKSFIDSIDGFLNKNKITMDDSVGAMSTAQNKMIETVNNDSNLLNSAQKRAKNIIEETIYQITGVSDDVYIINWEYEDNI